MTSIEHWVETIAFCDVCNTEQKNGTLMREVMKIQGGKQYIARLCNSCYISRIAQPLIDQLDKGNIVTVHSDTDNKTEFKLNKRP